MDKLESIPVPVPCTTGSSLFQEAVFHSEEPRLASRPQGGSASLRQEVRSLLLLAFSFSSLSPSPSFLLLVAFSFCRSFFQAFQVFRGLLKSFFHLAGLAPLITQLLYSKLVTLLVGGAAATTAPAAAPSFSFGGAGAAPAASTGAFSLGGTAAPAGKGMQFYRLFRRVQSLFFSTCYFDRKLAYKIDKG